VTFLALGERLEERFAIPFGEILKVSAPMSAQRIKARLQALTDKPARIIGPIMFDPVVEILATKIMGASHPAPQTFPLA